MLIEANVWASRSAARALRPGRRFKKGMEILGPPNTKVTYERIGWWEPDPEELLEPEPEELLEPEPEAALAGAGPEEALADAGRENESGWDEEGGVGTGGDLGLIHQLVMDVGVGASVTLITTWIIDKFRDRAIDITINRRELDLNDEGQVRKVVEEEIKIRGDKDVLGGRWTEL